MAENTLYYGDNLDILREHIADESVDLIHLDPPFNSRRSYNVLFKEAKGSAADSQITAFDGTWVNGVLLREGYARVAFYPPDIAYADALCALQAEAQTASAGGWSACPWTQPPRSACTTPQLN